MSMLRHGREEKAFAVLMSAFVVVLVLTSVIGVKLFSPFRNFCRMVFRRANYSDDGNSHLPDYLSAHRRGVRSLRWQKSEIDGHYWIRDELTLLVLIQTASLVPGLRFGHRATRTSDRSMKCNLPTNPFSAGNLDLRLHDRVPDRSIGRRQAFHLFKRRTGGTYGFETTDPPWFPNLSIPSS